MEDWMAFIDTVSPAICYNSGIDGRILQMWGLLRSGVVYFTRYQPGQHDSERWTAEQRALLTYRTIPKGRPTGRT
jgi:hypothetical protein